MKKSFIILPLVAAGLFVTLTSTKTGTTTNYTGSHGSTIGCGSCHGTAASGLTMSITLDSAGTAVTRYKPGMTYTVKLVCTNNTVDSLNGYGGQLSLVSGTGASSVTAGTLSAPTTGTTIRTGTGSIKYIEHTNRIAPTTGMGGVGTKYTISATWVAPVAGTGTVTAYGVINAVNCNNTDDAGDDWNNTNAAFTEIPSASLGTSIASEQDANMYPNPVSNVLYLSGYNGNYTVTNMAGSVIASGFAIGNTTINTSSWASGTYIVSVDDAVAKTIIKQ